MLSEPTNDKGNTIAPSRQLCAISVVKEWDRIPEGLVKRSLEFCEYKTMEELQIMGTIYQDSRVRIFQEAAGGAAARHFLDPKNEIGDIDESVKEGTWGVLDN